jgi:hypothetical protein
MDAAMKRAGAQDAADRLGLRSDELCQFTPLARPV